jgi:titin
VQSSTDSGATWTDFTDGVVATTGATVTELSNGTSYMFRVAAVTDFATGTFSPATAAIVPLAAPGAVTDLRAVPSSGQVVLVWQAPSSTGGRPVIDYHVEYQATHSESWVTYSRVPSAATSATITGLPASSGYVFRVTAVTDYTRGLAVETTEPVVLVPQPTRVTGRAANGSVLLAWMPPKVNRSLRVIDYRIQYSADGGATWITASKTASPSARATVRGLMKGTGYVFRVAAVTAKGVGAYSVSSARVTTRRI